MKKVLFPLALVSVSFLNAGLEDVKVAAQSYHTAYNNFKALPVATEYREAMGALKNLYKQGGLQLVDVSEKVAKKVTEWQQKGVLFNKIFLTFTPEEISQTIERFKKAHQAISDVSEYQALQKAKKAFKKEVLAYVKGNGWEGLADNLSGISEKMSRKVVEWEKKNR